MATDNGPHAIAHAARLIALQRAKSYGWLEGMTLQEIGDRLECNRSTAMRNLVAIEEAQDLADKYLEALAPHIPTTSP